MKQKNEYLEIQARAEGKYPMVTGIAYSGGKMKLFGWRHPIVVDLSGIEIPESIPLLANHENHTSGRVGLVRATIADGHLAISGEIVADGELTDEIVSQAKAGADWQLSIGAEVEAAELVQEGKRIVNGIEQDAPFFHIQKSTLREVSVVAVGADSATQMKVTASFKLIGERPNMEQKETETKTDEIATKAAIQQERERILKIKAICANDFSDIEAQAIQEGWTPEATTEKVLGAYRAKQPTADINIAKHAPAPDARKTLEAAVCLRAGIDEGEVVKSYGEQVIEAAYPDRDISLKAVMTECLKAEGQEVSRHFDNATIQAAFSTVTLPGILSNVANKKLLQAYAAQPIIATKLCTTGDLNDFKENERYRLTDMGDLLPVAADGEIQDGGISEETAKNQLDTFAKKFCLTRKMIINDDLGAFLKVPMAMGNRAARLIDQLFFKRLLANPAWNDGTALFHASHKNLLTGAASALSADSLKKAIQKFLDQTDSDGQPISVEPRYLVVPTALKHLAIELTRGATLIASGATETNRPASFCIAWENFSLTKLISSLRIEVRLGEGGITYFLAFIAPFHLPPKMSVRTRGITFYNFPCTNEIQNGISIVRKYDTIGRNAGIDFHNLSITNHYDSLGRFSTVEANGMTFVYRYLANSDLVSGYETDDFVREVAYETNRDLIASVSSHFDERLISSFVYVNDSVGRRTAVEKDGEAFGALQGVTDGYGYNQRSELVSARRTKGTDEIRGFDFDYEYDPIGNRRISALYDENNVRMESVYSANALNQYASRTIPGMVQIHGESVAGAVVDVNERPTFQTDGYFYGSAAVDNTESAVFAPIEVQSIIPTEEAGMLSQIYAETGSVFVAKTPEQFVYDLDGNMVQNGRFRFEWNGENRLVKAEELFAPTNREPMAVRYAYDHLERMVRKEISTESGEPLKTITYLWDGYNIIQESCNGQIARNIWGLDVDGRQQGAGGVGGLLAVVRDGTTYLPTYDANGNISEYIDHISGEVVAHYDYSSFGEQLIASYPFAHTFTHRFSTKPWCPITSLYEYQMRKYNPNLGRWLSRDPIEEKGGVILYGMCGNNMCDNYDYLGLAEIENKSINSIVIIYSKEFKYYIKGKSNCCKKKGKTKISAIPYVLLANSKIRSKQIGDIDAIINYNGEPFKTGFTSSVRVSDDLIRKTLLIDYDTVSFTKLLYYAGEVGTKPQNKFWAEKNIIIRCNSAKNQLKNILKEASECSRMNKEIIKELNSIIKMIDNARDVLTTYPYDISTENE